MKNFGFTSVAILSAALCACTVTNKPADDDPAGLQGEWRLDSYRIDCESTIFDETSNYKLSFNEDDKTFSLSTDCNMINGMFEVTDDTIHFKNMLVTEMACDNMIVEQNMLRLLNDSTAYATSHADSLAFTAPYIGSALFTRDSDGIKTFFGEYTSPEDGSTLQISKSSNSGSSIKIGLFRLTDIDDGIGKIADDTLTFTATDAAGNPIQGEITFDGDNATLVFTHSTWEYLPEGSTFHFKRTSRPE